MLPLGNIRVLKPEAVASSGFSGVTFTHDPKQSSAIWKTLPQDSEDFRCPIFIAACSSLAFFSVPGRHRKSWEGEHHKLPIWKSSFQPPEHQGPLSGSTESSWWCSFALQSAPAAAREGYCRFSRASWAVSLSAAWATLHIECNLSYVR